MPPYTLHWGDDEIECGDQTPAAAVEVHLQAYLENEDLDLIVSPFGRVYQMTVRVQRLDEIPAHTEQDRRALPAWVRRALTDLEREGAK